MNKATTQANFEKFKTSRHKEKFTETTNVPIEKVLVRPSIFQGRTVPFADETVKKIMVEGYDKSQEPIVLWRDTENNTNIVISGHSRFEAAKRIAKKDPSFKTIPAKFFRGDLDDAIDYAVIESNRSGKAEGIESDIKAYLRCVQRGYNKQFMLNIFKEESYLNTLRNLSYLSSSGEFIQNLAKTGSAKSFPYLVRNSEWVGQLRREYPQLTDAHEKEFFDFFYKNEKGLKVKKESLFDTIKKKVKGVDFNPKKSLNIANADYKARESSPGRKEYNRMQEAIESYNRERINKEELIAQAKLEKKDSLIPSFKKRIADINDAISVKLDQLMLLGSRIKAEDKRMEKSNMFGI